MSHFSVLVIGEDVEGQLQPYHEFDGWRQGQAAFNFLQKHRPDLAADVRASNFDGSSENVDPFYNDARLPEFLAWVESEW